MQLVSAPFVLFLTISLVVFYATPPRWRTVTFACVSLAFLWLVSPSALTIALLLGYVTFAFLLIHAVAVVKADWLFASAVAVLIALFVYLKSVEDLATLPFQSQLPFIVGLAFILLRCIDLVIECRGRPRRVPTPVQYINFVLSWPCLISGPIDTWHGYRRKLVHLRRACLTQDRIVPAFRRGVRGFFLIAVPATLCGQLFNGVLEAARNDPIPIALACAQCLYLLHLSFGFMGYMDIVISAGQLFGLSVPENFDRPWRAQSFLDFWTRWHITLSNWLKAHIFTTYVMHMSRGASGRNRIILHALVAYFITFFLIGLWHNPSLTAAIGGLLLGLGAVVNQAFRLAMRARPAAANLWIGVLQDYASAVLTFSFLVFALTPFWLSSAELAAILETYGASGILLSLAFETAIVGVAIAATMAARRLSLPSSLVERTSLRIIVTGSMITLIILCGYLFPSFSYTFFYTATR